MSLGRVPKSPLDDDVAAIQKAQKRKSVKGFIKGKKRRVKDVRIATFDEIKF